MTTIMSPPAMLQKRIQKRRAANSFPMSVCCSAGVATLCAACADVLVPDLAVAVEGAVARHHLVPGHAERIEIAARIVVAAAAHDLLGCDVARRARHEARAREVRRVLLAAHELRDAEVDDLHEVHEPVRVDE